MRLLSSTTDKLTRMFVFIHANLNFAIIKLVGLGFRCHRLVTVGM